MKELRSILILINLLFLSLIGSGQEKEKFMDFSYISPDQKPSRLYDIDTEYTLIYFYSPECIDCDKIKEKLIDNKYLDKLLKEETLCLIAVLPDVDKEYWMDNLDCVPKDWINAWNENDREIVSTYLYTVPTFFVLDRKKNIIKVPTERELLRWIKKIGK